MLPAELRYRARKGVTVAVAGRRGGTGRTTLVHVLGAGLAAYGADVLLLDTDPLLALTMQCGVKPHSHFHMGVVTPSGMVDTHAALVHRFDSGGTISVLAGRHRSEPIDREQVQALLAEARARYDYALVDSAPRDSLRIADLVDGVIGCARFEQDLLIDHIDGVYSPRYQAQREMVRRRLELLDWLDDQLDIEYPELADRIDEADSDDDAAIAALNADAAKLAAALIDARSTVGQQRFGPDWTVGAEIWRAGVQVSDSPAALPIFALHPDDPDTDLLDLSAVPGCADLAATFQPHDDDVLQVVTWHPIDTCLDNIRRQADRQGLPEEPTYWRHLGTALTWLPIDDGSVSGLGEMVDRVLDRAGASLLPPLAATSLGTPEDWRNWLRAAHDDELWRSGLALAEAVRGRTLGR
nr:AAA family ATPase [Nocardia carnea]